jgi:hypothetical protein
MAKTTKKTTTATTKTPSAARRRRTVAFKPDHVAETATQPKVDMTGFNADARQAAMATAVMESPDPRRPTAEEIARRAYEYYEARGGAPGDPMEDWFRAERELTRQ